MVTLTKQWRHQNLFLLLFCFCFFLGEKCDSEGAKIQKFVENGWYWPFFLLRGASGGAEPTTGGGMPPCPPWCRHCLNKIHNSMSSSYACLSKLCQNSWYPFILRGFPPKTDHLFESNGNSTLHDFLAPPLPVEIWILSLNPPNRWEPIILILIQFVTNGSICISSHTHMIM